MTEKHYTLKDTVQLALMWVGGLCWGGVGGKTETLLSNQPLSKVFASLVNKMVQLNFMWS